MNNKELERRLKIHDKREQTLLRQHSIARSNLKTQIARLTKRLALVEEEHGTALSARQKLRQADVDQYEATRFSLRNPAGRVVGINNVSAFCRYNNLSKSSVYKVLKGHLAKYKGWTKVVSNRC